MRDLPQRPVAVVGAPSSIGIRPYDSETEARHLDRAPAVLRDLGLVDRLSAEDLGDVSPAPYRDFRRPPRGVRNEREVLDYSRALADRVASALDAGCFPLVIGGDCSIVLGSLLGAGRRADRVALAYVDAHADFGTPQESLTGSAASMCLAMTVGRGDTPLASLAGPGPLVRSEDVVLIGRRDEGQTYYGHPALETSGILDLPWAAVAAERTDAITVAALGRLARSEVDGFWIHVDADVLDPRVMPAVDSPEPGGPDIDSLAALVGPLARHPKALGLQVTIYDPALDPYRSCAARLVTLLERILAVRSEETGERPRAGGVSPVRSSIRSS